MELSNANLAAQFFELHNLVVAHPDNPNDKYRAATYYHVGKVIRDYPEPVWKDAAKLLEIKGVGQSSVQKIEEAANAEDHLIPKLKELRLKYGNVQYKMHSAFCVLGLNDAKDVAFKSSKKGYMLIASIPSKMIKRCKGMMAGVCLKGETENEWVRDDIHFTLQLKGV